METLAITTKMGPAISTQGQICLYQGLIWGCGDTVYSPIKVAFSSKVVGLESAEPVSR